MQNGKIKEKYDAVKLIFLCFMAVYVTVREVSPLHWLIARQAVSAAIFLCGFGLILAGWFISGTCFADRRTDALALFAVVTVLSCAVNFKYGYADNIKALGAVALFFFLFFDAGIGKTKDRQKREINCITGTLNTVWAFFTFASVLMFSLSICLRVQDGGWVDTFQGFLARINRLWGVFNDPNYAGYVSIVVILASLRFIINTKRPFVRVINAANLLLQLIFLTLSGSFSATLILLAAVCVFAFYAAMSKHREKTARSYVKSFVAAALCSVVCYGLLTVGQYALPYVRHLNELLPERVPETVTEMYFKLYQHSDLEILSKESAYGRNGTKAAVGTSPIKRTDTAEAKGNEDISHGRFDRWKQALEIFAVTPVIGTSPRNLSPYAKVYFPDTLMAKYNMAPHNGYLDILVGTGVLGLAAFLLFFVPALIALLKKYFRFENDADFLFSAVTVFVLAASAMFVSDLFFMISIGGFLFWTFFGYALHTDGSASEKQGLMMKLYETVFKRKGRAV